MKVRHSKTVLSLLLTLAMVLSLVPGMAVAAEAAPDKHGTATVAMMHESKDQLSMCDPMFDATADISVTDGMATVKLLVANPVPGFPDQGADGTVKNVKVTYNDVAYEVTAEVGTDAKMTAKVDNALFGLTAGEQYPAQTMSVTLPEAAIVEGALLKTDAYVNVVMNTDVVFRMKLTNIAWDEAGTPDPDVPDPDVPDAPAADKTGAATVAMMHESKDQLSMCDPMFDAKAAISVTDGMATVKLLVANPVPGFPDQGADGTVKNVVVTYNDVAYEAVSAVGTDAKMTAKVDNALFGLTAGEQYPAQVLTVTLPEAAIVEGALLKTDAYVNVVMNTDVVFQMKLTNIAWDEAGTPDPDVPDPDVPDPDVPDVPAADKTGAAAVAMLHESKDQLSMCDPMFDAKAAISVTDGMATVKLLVANPVPGFPDQGADGTVKNVVVTYNDVAYEAVSAVGTDAKMTAKADNDLFGLTAGEQYPAQVLTVTLPEAAIVEGALLKTDAYVNVVMNTDVVFRMQLTNIAWDEAGTPDPDVPDPDVPDPDVPDTPVADVRADSAALSVSDKLDANGAAVFTLSLDKPQNIAAIEVSYTSNGQAAIEGLNGFQVIGQKDGSVVLAYLHEGQMTDEVAVGVVQFTVTAEQDANVKITGIKIAGRDAAGTEVYGTIVGGIDPSDVTYVNMYDVNRDGVIDLLDLVAAQRYYMATEGEGMKCDFNGDQVVDLTDYIDLYNHFE